MTASISNDHKILDNATGSRTSALWKAGLWPMILSIASKVSKEEFARLSKRTVCMPDCSKATQVCEPIYQRPPVRRTDFIYSIMGLWRYSGIFQNPKNSSTSIPGIIPAHIEISIMQFQILLLMKRRVINGICAFRNQWPTV